MSLFDKLRKHVDIFELLRVLDVDGARDAIEGGIDVHATNEDGMTALLVACSVVDAKSYVDFEKLQACRFDRAIVHMTRVAELLIRNGADINASAPADLRNFAGFAPIHFAVAGLPDMKFEMLQVLVERRADLNAKTCDGRTALDMARARKHLRCMAVLERHGALAMEGADGEEESEAKTEAEGVARERGNDLRIPLGSVRGMAPSGVIEEILGRVRSAFAREGGFAGTGAGKGHIALYATGELDKAVRAGGFEGYFSGAAGGRAREALDGLRLIGAEELRGFFVSALKVFGKEYPISRGKRQERMALLESPAPETWRELSAAFVDAEEGAARRQIEYVEAHGAEFFTED